MATLRAWGYLPQKNTLKDLLVRFIGHPHPYGRVRANCVLDLINYSSKTLDVGCGEGVFTRELASRGLDMTGVDLDADAIAAAENNKKTLNLRYKTFVGDAAQLTFANAEYEQVISTDVVEHVESPIQALKEIRRVLKKSGHFIVTVPTPRYLAEPFIKHDFSAHLRQIGHIHHGWYYEDFSKMLNEAGFAVEEYRYFGHFPLQVLMELAFIKMGPDKIANERRGLYNLKWSTLIQFMVVWPVIWADQFFAKHKRAAFLAVRARAI